MNYQDEIAKLTKERGYRAGWTDEQFAARQVAKLVEEVGEACANVAIWDESEAFIWKVMMFDVAKLARAHFDNFAQWGSASVHKDIADEAADCLVVLYNLADALDVDLNELALEKARSDVERGVR